MAKIRDALSSLPTRPLAVIVPLIVALVLTLYYRDRYQQCDTIRQDRETLIGRLRAADAPARMRLADITDFDWERVRIVDRVEPGMLQVDCPMGWNWASGERERLIREELLSAMIFGQGGRIARYIEWRNDEIVFAEIDGELTRESAVFDLAGKFSLPMVLTPVTLETR